MHSPIEHAGSVAAGVLLVFVTPGWSAEYWIRGDPGGWAPLLESIGLHAGVRERAAVAVGSLAPSGGITVVEGGSALAVELGARALPEAVRIQSIVDARRPGLSIIWEQAVTAPRFELPPGATVFAKERWTGAPTLAGWQSAGRRVLWSVTGPGASGYERFPYLPQALVDLGLALPFRSPRLWAFFDSSYRLRVDLDWFAKRWRQAGISGLHVAAWHFYDADAGRDDYLRRLIDACHRQGIVLYAWLELPHVSEAFWNQHPEWREKTATLHDAHLDWRKLMNLSNPDCFHEVAAGVKNLLGRFDWDGVNLAELYFESLQGADDPSRFTPMNDEVRARFRRERGVDPVELFRGARDPALLRAFLDFRVSLARRMQQQWLEVIEGVRREKPDLDVVLTHVDDRFDARMKDALGVDAARVLPLLEQRDFTFLIEDPATIWHLGPKRYPEIAARYRPLTRETSRLAIDINVVERYQNVYPTRQQTGAELFQLVHLAAGAFSRIALYAENSLLEPDLPLLAASAAIARMEQKGPETLVESRHGVSVRWQGGATVDGKAWPAWGSGFVHLPPGRHSLRPGPATALQLLDFTGTLLDVTGSEGGLSIRFASPARAAAVLNRLPGEIRVDGVKRNLPIIPANGHWVVLLPRGTHTAFIPLPADIP